MLDYEVTGQRVDNYKKKQGTAQGTFFTLALVGALIQRNGEATSAGAASGIWQSGSFHGKATKAGLEVFKTQYTRTK